MTVFATGLADRPRARLAEDAEAGTMRIGEALVGNKLIDSQQLQQALDAQLIYGGHLGTCLVELGFVDTETLGRALSLIHGVAHAPRDAVLEPETEALDAVPQLMVERHAAVPFRVEDRTIHLAMIDPTNLVRIDEVAFATGRPVRPFVSPEVVVCSAMERFYGIPRRMRYIAMPGNRRPAPKKPTETAAEPEVLDAIGALASPTDTPAATEQPRGIEGGKVSFGRQNLVVSWVKRVRDDAVEREARWCNLFDLPLDHPHFEQLEGVYVVWHHGVDPVLRVGQGGIRAGLRSLLNDERVRAEHESADLWVTWAEVPVAQRGGVAGYLTRMLQPRVGTESGASPDIEVNLPQ
jgi:hypothetical protein